ncbi:hypothetical protein AVEN_181398-1 [Araneus ventricosus]|uniref:Uncharacterized protein n=1 Tax=Araneus ventricosus TaxID=182803 RepID=A0A4Y2LCI1_ARAVE|nr:hypothetical protein AVEN_181398-1 [Araneus ventricosus]
MHTLKNNTGNQIEVNHSFPNVKREMDFGLFWGWAFKSFLAIKGLIRTRCWKEAADMGCDHQQMELSAQQTLGKIDDIIAYS